MVIKSLAGLIETHLGANSRITKFLFLNQAGFDVLGIDCVPGSGKGGMLHRYWQSAIKSHAEGLGFMAEIEEQVSANGEAVDVGLRRDDKRMAVEISITTNAGQELGNIQKCIIAGYDNILVLTLEEAKLSELKKLVGDTLPEEEISKVSVGLIYDFCRLIK